MWDPETLLAVPVVRLHALNGGCWRHGDGSRAIFERRSADQIHCGAMDFGFIPPPERVQSFLVQILHILHFQLALVGVCEGKISSAEALLRISCMDARLFVSITNSW